jgi:EAL domain-containing protein (putative c-di-GMP-specific phosphodiesterase class I)
VAEETGTIVPIGTWVLEEACRQLAQWKTNFPACELRLSLNLSPVQVFQANIVEAVSGALERWAIEPTELVLELTEDVMVKDMDLAATRLRQLKDLGVYLAIDDFGTGYASLGYLMHLPFDILKIDKEFVDRVAMSPKESAVSRAIINLAHSFEMHTVAEGVEQPEQAAALRDLGCGFAQGYLFAKPMPAPEVDVVLPPVEGSSRRRSP